MIANMVLLTLGAACGSVLAALIAYPAWHLFWYVRRLRQDRARVAEAVRRLAVTVATNGQAIDGCTELLQVAQQSSWPLSFWDEL